MNTTETAKQAHQAALPMRKTRQAEIDRDVKLTQLRVLRSEAIKLHSLRSTLWALLAAVVTIVGGGAFTAVGILVNHDPLAAESLVADPSGGTLSAVGYAQLAAIALGVIAATGEYRTRMIRSSLAAVPTRLPLVWGKAAVVAAATATVSLLIPSLAAARRAAPSRRSPR